MMWTKEVPTEPGWYLWRVEFPGEPPAVEPFLIYPLPSGDQRVQELSTTREGTNLGGWELTEWRYRASQNDDAYGRESEYLFIGRNVEYALVRAFRELYHAAVSAHRDMMWTPDFSDNGLAVASELAAAISEIHKET